MEKYFDTRLNLEFRRDADAVWRLVASDILRKLRVKIHSVLDLGAGYGNFINQVGAETRWAADIWSGMREHLAPKVRSAVGDIRNPITEIPRDYFDLCFLSNVLEHFSIEDAALVLKNAHAYLKSGGHIAILQPNFTYCYKNYFDDYTHKTVFTAEGLRNFLMDNGFYIVDCQPRYLPFSFKSKFPRPLWMVALYLRLPWKPLAAQMLLIAKKNA